MTTSAVEVYSLNQAKSRHEMDIALHGDFCFFVSKCQMYLWKLKDDKIQCHRVEDNKEYVTYVDHMKRLHKDIFGSPTKDPLPQRSCEDTIKLFHKTEPKKRVFVWNGGYYLVKKSFTEGVQYVKEGEKHTYKAFGKPLDIYIYNRPFEPNILRSSCDEYTISERISPGETKIIPSNTYYIAIAPCHTFFKKGTINTSVIEGFPEITPSFETEANYRMDVAEDRNECPSSVQTNQTEEFCMLPGPSGSRDNEHGISRRSMELESVNQPQLVNGSASSKRKRACESDKPSKRDTSSTPSPKPSTSQMPVSLLPPSPNFLRDEMEQNINIPASNGTTINNHQGAVFAIRKDRNIESYALKPDSTFRILPDNIMAGSFAIENDDMDPNVFEYHGDGQCIRELAKFKNGSVFETTLTVEKDLLKELQDPTKKKEKVVVNYFFEIAFKSIEAAYIRFSEMRNVRMIGSCVPAIILLKNTKFSGAISDDYE